MNLSRLVAYLASLMAPSIASVPELVKKTFLLSAPGMVLAKRSASCGMLDRKSTRLNSSHQIISYAVFCLKKKTLAVRSYVTTAYGDRHSLMYLRRMLIMRTVNGG